MPFEQHFAGVESDVLTALEGAIRQSEKVEAFDRAARLIKFETKGSGFKRGATWVMQVQPIGATSCLVVAKVVSMGSLIAEVSERKKIGSIFDVAESLLPKTPASSDNAAIVSAGPLVAPDVSPKHQHLIGSILSALAEAEAAASAGDVLAEERAIALAYATASETGLLASRPSTWCYEEVRARIAAGRLRKGADLIATIGTNLWLLSDRILQGDTVRVLDGQVSASVEVGGQVLQSTRPTMTRMAIGSVLPGSALLVGLATPKAKTTDMRTASFILVHPSWRIVEPIDPDGAHTVSGVAAQINAIAAQKRAAPEPAPIAAAAALTSVADELAKLAQLRDAGVLTDDEFQSQKARILG